MRTTVQGFNLNESRFLMEKFRKYDDTCLFRTANKIITKMRETRKTRTKNEESSSRSPSSLMIDSGAMGTKRKKIESRELVRSNADSADWRRVKLFLLTIQPAGAKAQNYQNG